MGKPIAKKGDMLKGDRGAPPVPIEFNCSSNVLINGQPAALNGSMGPVHGCPKTHEDYVNPTIIATTTTILINGIPAARLGDPCQCGSEVITASGNVSVG